MTDKKIYDNKILFAMYGVVNMLLLLILLTLLILLYNDIYILSRLGFVVFIGIHLLLLFFIKIHFLRIVYDEEAQEIKFWYNKRFSLRWQQKAREVSLPLAHLDGYSFSKDFMGNPMVSFFKLEQKEHFELGPFYVGFISKKEKEALADAFGEPL